MFDPSLSTKISYREEPKEINLEPTAPWVPEGKLEVKQKNRSSVKTIVKKVGDRVLPLIGLLILLGIGYYITQTLLSIYY